MNPNQTALDLISVLPQYPKLCWWDLKQKRQIYPAFRTIT